MIESVTAPGSALGGWAASRLPFAFLFAFLAAGNPLI